MINHQQNPWSNMECGTQRRVDYVTHHDYFWIVDFNQRYGFFMKLKISHNIETDISMKGINITFGKSVDNNVEIYLILEKQEDWEVFHALCSDLIYVIDFHQSDSEKISILIKRLEKWKSLLADRRQLSKSVEQQMGIFSELYCIKNIIAKKKGFNVAIRSWVGMEKDKQDFNLDTCVIEVKSHITTKGNVASISSANQLYSEKDEFYLISYGLTLNDQGLTIDDLFDEILSKLSLSDGELLIEKLFEFGWIPHHRKLKKAKFIVDSETIYNVDSDFPKISYELIDWRIINVKYKIDLSKCSKHICTIDNLFVVNK